MLESLGLELELVRDDVARIVGLGDEEVRAGQIPFTPDAKKVLELSLREALSLGHSYISPGHVLLGLNREEEGVAARILRERGIAGDVVRDRVLEHLPAEAPQRRGFRERLSFRSLRQWEYRVEEGLDPERLDALGADGWELVAAVPRGEQVQLVFKRPAQLPGAERRSA